MLVPLLIFIVLSCLCVSGMGWFAIIPILFMWLILAFISDHYEAHPEEMFTDTGKKGIAKNRGEESARRYPGDKPERGWEKAQEERQRFEGLYRIGLRWPKNLREAAETWSEAADEGVTEAQFNLGLMYDKGLGVPQDIPKAIGYYQKAALSGNGKALYNLGLMRQLGDGLPQDISKAVELYEKAAVRCEMDAMLALAFLYAEGSQLPQDVKKAKEWYARAALQFGKSAEAARFTLGNLCGEAEILQNELEQALEWHKKAGADGSPEAWFIAGHVYEEGVKHFLYKMIPADSAKAIECYKNAAVRGHSGAMRGLGRLCGGGAEAVMWLEKAAELGNSGAMYDLYKIYSDGRGVPENFSKARKWLKKSAAMGNERAQWKLDH